MNSSGLERSLILQRRHYQARRYDFNELVFSLIGIDIPVRVHMTLPNS
jgi:hypothetical protein